LSVDSILNLTLELSGDVPRVCGQLAVSRAFGDRNLKSLLRSEPDIKVEDIDHTAELLVLASDGLWKVWHVISKFVQKARI